MYIMYIEQHEQCNIFKLQKYQPLGKSYHD